MHYSPENNDQRATNGDELLAVYIREAARAAEEFGEDDRANIGRMMAIAYRPLMDGRTTAEALCDLIADLYHGADGIISPGSMLGNALMELSTVVNMVPTLCAMGADAKADLYAGALAAALVYADYVGVCAPCLTDAAYLRWSEEAEEARFMILRTERHGCK
ncbi:hypothetical protein ACLQ2E_35775 [Streptomyces lavendulocolor]